MDAVPANRRGCFQEFLAPFYVEGTDKIRSDFRKNSLKPG